MRKKNARTSYILLPLRNLRKRCLLKYFYLVLAIMVLSILYVKLKSKQNLSTTFHSKLKAFHYTTDWRHVFKEVHVYSAFWEYRTTPKMVRIIGMGERLQNYSSQLICLMKYEENNIAVTPATSSNLEDHHDMMLCVKFFYCKAETKPEKVALVSGECKWVSWLEVHDTEPLKNVSKNKIALCTQPLHITPGKPLTNFNVAEFVAFYELLGVSQFVFYGYKIDNDTTSFLNRLSQAGSSIEVMSWTIPKQGWYIWNMGQIASVADCVYKHASSYEYVAIIDIDEYVVPSANVTLQKLLQEIVKINGSNWSSYMFRHTFFCLDYPDDPMVQNISLPLVTQMKTWRGKIWGPYARAKSIVRPSLVVMPGIHYTWEALPNWNTSFDISPSVALLHHYRQNICEDMDVNIDRRAWRYRNSLLQSKVIRRWQEYNLKNH